MTQQTKKPSLLPVFSGIAAVLLLCAFVWVFMRDTPMRTDALNPKPPPGTADDNAREQVK